MISWIGSYIYVKFNVFGVIRNDFWGYLSAGGDFICKGKLMRSSCRNIFSFN